MTADKEQVPMKQIVYWQDGYFLDMEDALGLIDVFDSSDIFEGKHKTMWVPATARLIQIQSLMCFDDDPNPNC